ncbi:MAG: 50S ribosomal protein L22 [Parcubacteria group bacterium]|nr:MAG: 50S ribosomal protein L22 [Parcubacteria group bacterium]
MPEAKAKLKNIGLSPKKIRLVADVIRGQAVPQALARLQVVFKRSAPIVAKLLNSAVANAQNKFDVKAEDLFVKSIIVNKSVDLKRWKPAAFGTAHPFRKHTAHVEIVVASKEGAAVTVKEKTEQKIDTVDLTKTDKRVHGPVTDTKTKVEAKKGFFGRQTKLAKGKDNLNVKKG